MCRNFRFATQEWRQEITSVIEVSLEGKFWRSRNRI